jgi:hypothetical protein
MSVIYDTGQAQAPQTDPGNNFKQHFRNFLITLAAVGATIIAGYLSAQIYQTLTAPKPIDATFLLNQSVFEALPLSTRRKIEDGKINTEESGANEGGGNGGSPQSPCIGRTILSVAGIGLVCEIAKGLLTQNIKPPNTIVVDATKGKVIVHTYSGGSGSTVVVGKNGTQEFKPEPGREPMSCDKIIDSVRTAIDKST